MKNKSMATVAASRVASFGAIWLATTLLQTERGRKISKKVDKKIDRATSNVGDSLTSAGRRVRSNAAWTAVGLTAIAIGGALLTKAARD